MANTPTRGPQSNALSLAGTWAFRLDADATGIAFTESWTVGTAGEAIIGEINFFDGKGDFISMQAGAVTLPPAVPEPSTAAILTAALCGFGLRRRRPRG